MKGIGGFFGWLGSMLAMALGSTLYISFMIFMFLSLPFNVIALMRWTGWEWWGALILAIFLMCIPLVGQLAYLVCAVAGAYFFIAAGFSWQRAVHATVTPIKWNEM